MLSYGLKHSVKPRGIATETIVSSVEAALSRHRDLSEPGKENIRSVLDSNYYISFVLVFPRVIAL